MRFAILLAMILAYFRAAGQQPAARVEVSGIVLDSIRHKPMLTASVSLLTQRDSAYVTAGVTDGNGRFRFKSVSAGRYRLLVTFIGYRNKSVFFEVSGDGPLRLDTLWMNGQATDLYSIQT